MVNDKKNELFGQSPCVRNCCLNNDDMCLGCFRYLQEITSWQSLNEQEKQHVIIACQQRRESLKN